MNPLDTILNGAKKILEGGKNAIISTFTKPKAMEFNVGEGLSSDQKVIAEKKIEQLSTPLPKNDLQANIKQAFTPAPQESRVPFSTKTVVSDVPPIIKASGEFGRDIVESIPRGVATIYGETIGKGKAVDGKVNLGFDAQRLGFTDPKYVTAQKEYETAVKEGEHPFTAGLRIVSTKALDAAIAGQFFTSIAKTLSKNLLKAGTEQLVDAWALLGKAKTVDQAKSQGRKMLVEASNLTNGFSTGGTEYAKKVTEAIKLVESKGIPSVTTRVSVPVGRVADVVGRETPITKNFFSDFAKPNISRKVSDMPPAPVAGYLPGTRPLGGKVQPKLGLSTQPVERVGGEVPKPIVPKKEIKLYRGGTEDGNYFTTSKVVAGDFAKNRGGNIKEYTLNPDAKIIKYDDIPGIKYKGINDDTLARFVIPTGKSKLEFMEKDLEADYSKATEWAKNNGYDAIEFGTEGEIRKITNKAINKEISLVDRLIAEGKIRVKSVDGRDAYQVKKGNEWKNARDEDSAVAQVTKTTVSKPKAQLPEDLQMRQEQLAIRKEALKESPLAQLTKYTATRGEFAGKLPEVLGKGKSKFGTKGDQIINEVFGSKDTYAKANDVEDIRAQYEKYSERVALIKEEERALKEEVAMYKAKLKETPKAVEEITPTVAKKEVPLVSGEQGEVKSLQIAAKQAEDILNGEVVPPGVSLPRIISKTVTPNNRKVHFIDTLLTTPKYVLEKIGFGAEYKDLRRAMDSYWKELPKNIEKITAWSKRVPAESNERIFKFLDGQAITLNPTEQEVANEIRAWLKEWANRLGLKGDNTVTEYITHIFDKELVTGEFDEDLAKIIAERIPGAVYNPFTMKRLGARGYRQDTWAALDAYVKRGTRKVHMDPVLEKIQEKTGKSLDMTPIEESQFKYIKRYIDNINMRPTDLDKSIDTFIKDISGNRFGQRPVTYLTRLLRQATSRGMLGLNPGSALRNLSQGANTYATLGEKYTAIGYASLFKKGAKAELEAEGVLNAGLVQDKVLSSTKKALQTIDKGLFSLFQAAEYINRGSAYFGAKSKALAEGKTLDEAVEYAKDIVRKTQFSFDSVDTPVGMQSDIVKTLFQFQTYTTKQLEFLTRMAKDKNFVGLLRYFGSALIFVYTIGQAFNMKPKEILPIYRLDVPSSLKGPIEILKAVADTPDKYGQPRTIGQKFSDIGKSFVGYVPAGNQIKKTIEGVQSIQEGGSYDKAGKLQFEQGQSWPEKIQTVLFGKYAQENAQDYFNRVKISAEEKSKVMPVYEEVKKLKDAGESEQAQALIEDLSDADYDVFKKIVASEKAKKTLEGKRQILKTYNEVKKLKDEGKVAEAQEKIDALSDEEYKYFEAVVKDMKNKSKASNGNAPQYEDGSTQSENSIIDNVVAYAKALGTDPLTAFNRIFTNQKIRYVTNGVIVVERMPLEASQAIKKEQGGNNPEMKLDHTVPLQLGGSNSKDNLKLVPTDLWATYTPVENALGLAIRSKKISKDEAQKLIKDFKDGKITSEDVYLSIK